MPKTTNKQTNNPSALATFMKFKFSEFPEYPQDISKRPGSKEKDKQQGYLQNHGQSFRKS